MHIQISVQIKAVFEVGVSNQAYVHVHMYLLDAKHAPHVELQVPDRSLFILLYICGDGPCMHLYAQSKRRSLTYASVISNVSIRVFLDDTAMQCAAGIGGGQASRAAYRGVRSTQPRLRSSSKQRRVGGWRPSPVQNQVRHGSLCHAYPHCPHIILALPLSRLGCSLTLAIANLNLCFYMDVASIDVLNITSHSI